MTIGGAEFSYRKHLIGLVEDEHLHAVGLEEATLDHVVNTAGGSDNDLGAVLESLHVIAHTGSTNAGVALNVHEVTNGDNDLLDLLSQLTGGGENQSLALLHIGVDLLENGNGEGGSLPSTGLGLSDDIVALDNGHNRTLLDSRGALETIGVDCVGSERRAGIRVVGKLAKKDLPPRRSSALRFISSKESTDSS